MSTAIYVYFTNDRTSTVHLVNEHDTLKSIANGIVSRFNPLTVCGHDTGHGSWTMGDETTSGIAATCKSCLKVAGLAQEKEASPADHWEAHESVSDWQYEVANGDTRLGWQEWKRANVE